MLNQRRKRSMVWYSDFILGLTIFLIGLTISILYIKNSFVLSREGINEVSFSANLVSEALLTSGVPQDWNQTNVFRIGLTDDNYRLNITKLRSFENISIDQYEHSKALLGTNYDYLIYFKDKYNNTLRLTSTAMTASPYFGKSGVNESTISYLDNENLIAVSRYLVYQKVDGNEVDTQIIKMVINLWK